MGSVEAVESEISRLKAKVLVVEAEIKEVNRRIEAAEKAGKESPVPRSGPKKWSSWYRSWWSPWWVKEVEQLREEKNKLREEKNKLLDIENKLRDEKARLQAAGQPAGPLTSVPPTSSTPSKRRATGDDVWSPELETRLKRQITKDAQAWHDRGAHFPTWECPQGHRYFESLQNIPEFQDNPSLLLHDLPNDLSEGKSQAAALWAAICESRELQEKIHDMTAARHLTLGLGPSGCGKTRTNLELLCNFFGFYWTFRPEVNPGPTILERAVARLSSKIDDRGDTPDYDAVVRLKDLKAMQKRLLVLHLLALEVFLELGYKPKDFLVYQLMGRDKKEGGRLVKSWQTVFWEELINVSNAEINCALENLKERVLIQLKSGNQQPFLPVILDEAQVGMSMLPQHFPATDPTSGLRPLLNGMVRNLEDEAFDGFHHIATGTGLSMRHRHDLSSTIGKRVGGFHIFHEYGMLTDEQALEQVCAFFDINPPSDCSRLWYFKGRYRFLTNLLEEFIRLGASQPMDIGTDEVWSNAITGVVELHTCSDMAEQEESFLNKLERLNLRAEPLYNRIIAALKVLVKFYYFYGTAYMAASTDVDMVHLGVCFLAVQQHEPEQGTVILRKSPNYWVELAEPMVAVGLRNFLEDKECWSIADAAEDAVRQSCKEPSSQGFIWEHFLKERQELFLGQYALLADHPLLAEACSAGKLPGSFYQKARFIVLDNKGELCQQPELVPETHSPGRGLIDYVLKPNCKAAFFPDKLTGPDLCHFFMLGDELWFAMVQAKFAEDLGGKVQAALATVYIESMFGSGESSPSKREALREALFRRGVKGLLHMLVVYPYGPQHLDTFPERQSLRKQDDFYHAKVAVTGANAQLYWDSKQIALFGSLKKRPLRGGGPSTKKLKGAGLAKTHSQGRP